MALAKSKMLFRLFEELDKGEYNNDGIVYAVVYKKSVAYYAFTAYIHPTKYEERLDDDREVEKYARIGAIVLSKFTRKTHINWIKKI